MLVVTAILVSLPSPKAPHGRQAAPHPWARRRRLKPTPSLDGSHFLRPWPSRSVKVGTQQSLSIAMVRQAEGRNRNPQRRNGCEGCTWEQASLNLSIAGASVTTHSVAGARGNPRILAGGSIAITTATSGPASDADGYLISIDGVTGTSIAANATIQRDNLEPRHSRCPTHQRRRKLHRSEHEPAASHRYRRAEGQATFSVLCPPAVPYRATDLGVLPAGNCSTATDINSAGQVVGIGEVPIVALGATSPSSGKMA